MDKMTDGQVIKSLWDKGLGTWEIHEITGLPENRVYNTLSAYRKERYSVYGQAKQVQEHQNGN